MKHLTKKEKEDMKRFIKTVSLFIVLLVSLIGMYAYITHGVLKSEFLTEWIHEYIQVKEDIAHNMTGNKLMLLSGSNSLYSISCEQIQNETGVQCLNYGTCTTLVDYFFDRAKRLLNPGDMVLMPLEYGYYYEYDDKIMFEDQTLKAEYVMTHDQEYFKSCDLMTKINYELIGFKDVLTDASANKKEFGVGYNAVQINKYGDFNKNNYTKEFDKVFLSFPYNFKYQFDHGPFTYNSVKPIEDFIDWCSANNVTLIATFPSTYFYSDYNSDEYKDAFDLITQFYQKRNVPVLGTPYDFFYKYESLFYNSIYHLNDKGRKINTDKIIRMMKEEGLI